PGVPSQHQHAHVHDRRCRPDDIPGRVRQPGAARYCLGASRWVLAASSQLPVPGPRDLICHTLHVSSIQARFLYRFLVEAGMSLANQVVTEEWVTFPGGELEGKRPKVLCSACREALKREAATYGRSGAGRRSRLLCFDCYRADLARARALKEAGELDTASDARFQTQLPFEPVNHGRLDLLKADRAQA